MNRRLNYSYPCIAVKQSKSDKWLVQFAAPATEIAVWSGVPQKTKFDFAGPIKPETVGFQREENKTRIRDICDFYRNPDNIIQNPLLCSLRDDSSVRFVASSGQPTNATIRTGHLEIQAPEHTSISLFDCLTSVRAQLEGRLPDLKGRTPDASLIADIKSLASERGVILDTDADDADGADDAVDTSSDPEEQMEPTAALFEESHIVDFWHHIAALHEVLKLATHDTDEFLGYTKSALLAYVLPIVLVDGQHRLRGAIVAADSAWESEEIQQESADRIAAGESTDAVRDSIRRREARILPVSLLMTAHPAEQVFQFVVVNQKATAIRRPLLGTIVSTTLTNDEIDAVSRRLSDAGIRIEESQAITSLIRDPSSPFCNLVERGLAGDRHDVLQWNVFAQLVQLFRRLRGGKIFGQNPDHAAIWCRKYLPKSGVVADHQEQGYEQPEDYWGRSSGPWRSVFIEFWCQIRDTFGNTSVPDKPNYWGRPRTSNLFNKVSLTILAADFFQFLSDRGEPIHTIGDVSRLMQDWLVDVKPVYFDRNWHLSGVKKDSTGIRNKWAVIWLDYRKEGGNLPHVSGYSKPKGS